MTLYFHRLLPFDVNANSLLDTVRYKPEAFTSKGSSLWKYKVPYFIDMHIQTDTSRSEHVPSQSILGVPVSVCHISYCMSIKYGLSASFMVKALRGYFLMTVFQGIPTNNSELG
jgi:hypothetical protein